MRIECTKLDRGCHQSSPARNSPPEMVEWPAVSVSCVTIVGLLLMSPGVAKDGCIGCPVRMPPRSGDGRARAGDQASAHHHDTAHARALQLGTGLHFIGVMATTT